jgi:hypothetical protein
MPEDEDFVVDEYELFIMDAFIIDGYPISLSYVVYMMTINGTLRNELINLN